MRLSIFLALLMPICAELIAQPVGETPSNKLLSVIWQQQSAEYRALCYQAFNVATWKLDTLQMKANTRYAIITDIDETVLDNSYYEADNIRNNAEYKADTWKEWTCKAGATPVPGAMEFFQLAATKGITIFYLSNRDTSEVRPTIANLRRCNFPDADAAHMLFMSKTSSKEERRLLIMKDYQVVLLLGDNLNDFTMVFEKKANADRLAEADRIRNEWGHKFIVLPNATYGEWENAAYDYERKLDQRQKNKKLIEKLVGSQKR